MNSQDASLNEIVTSGDKEALEDLLATGVDVNLASKGGQTPLILAIVSGHLRLLHMLLAAGADPFIRDNTGLNAIEWADRKGLPDIARLLTHPIDLPSGEPSRRVSSKEDHKPVIASPPLPEPPRNRSLSSDEKSRRWIAGLKQRLDEQASRTQHPTQESQTFSAGEQPDPPHESTQLLAKEVESEMISATSPDHVVIPDPAPQVQSEVKSEVKSEVLEPATPPRLDVIQETAPQVQSEVKSEVLETAMPPRRPPDHITTPPDTLERGISTTPLPDTSSSPDLPVATPKPSKRKRCPECNTVYNSDLLAYCSYHVVALVDIDAPVVIPEDKSRKGTLLWILIILTFAGAVLTAYWLFRPLDQENKKIAAPSSTPSPADKRKGLPVANGQLKSSVVDLPAAETTAKVESKPVVVVVRVRVDKTGRVYSAQSNRVGEEFRRAAIAAARKATFSVEKLHGNETEGTISYTFMP